ncbi:hypothetical protein [Streptomyces abikoensis]|uniref:hypothetical protein n=1 Tax=Streptomyces abikoensis TaxID=97398 RepID=UPI001673CA3D|nr:hypothetical protein [Streptomyces abikoensis]GGP55775.1 hypothetical protein GCM10010214_31210 [Streptomyces abikoensis]
MEFEAADFDDFAAGDRIRFVTANNGYDGTGEGVWRTGTVTRISASTMTIACDPNIIGKTARIRRATWTYRAPQRAATSQTPYSAEYVHVVDMGATVWALYIPNPDHARDPRNVADNFLDPKYANVELIATAERFRKCDDNGFSGWVVAGNGGNSDPIPTKRQAMRDLRAVICDHFKPSEGSATEETNEGNKGRTRPFVDELTVVAPPESPRVGERVTYKLGRRITVTATVVWPLNEAGQVGVVDDGDRTGSIRYVNVAPGLTVHAPDIDSLHAETLYENQLRTAFIAEAARHRI